MNLLPVVQRELVQASRKTRTFAVRLGAAVLGSGVAGIMLISAIFGGGKTLFGLLSILAFIGCSLAGIFLTADCLRAEKREGTLGLLFLTDLRAYDVVLGKWVGAGLNAIMALLALFPVFAIGWMLGGVTAGEFWRTALALLLTLIFFLSVGIAVSAHGRGQAEGMAGAAFWTLVFTLGWPALAAAAAAHPRFAPWTHVFSLSPVSCFRRASDLSYTLAPNLFWRSAAAVSGWSAVALGFACWILPRRWQEGSATGAPPEVWKSWLKTALFGAGLEGYAERTLVAKLLDKNPILALQARAPVIRKLAWLCAAVGGIGGISIGFIERPRSIIRSSAVGATFFFGSVGPNPAYFLILAGILGIVLLFAWQACGFFREARRSGLLDLLATTPLTDLQILRGQWQALFRIFFFPALLLIGAGAAGSMAVAAVHSSKFGGTLALFLWLFIAADLWVTCTALAWAGAWHGLHDDRRQLAFLKTVASVLVPKIFFIPTCLCGGFPLLAQPFVGLAVCLVYRHKFEFGIRRILIGPREVGERSWAPMWHDPS